MATINAITGNLEERFIWTPCEDPYLTEVGAVLETEAADGARIVFFLEDHDNMIIPTFTVYHDNKAFSSETPDEWHQISAYIPRAEWPEEMYAGHKTTTERTPDAAILAAIRQYREELDELNAE